MIEEAFDDVRQRGKELLIPEPRLRAAQAEENAAIGTLDDRIDEILPATFSAEEKLRCTQALWSVLTGC